MMLEKHAIEAIAKQLKAELLPIGCILIYSSDKVPQDFLPCDGRELSKTTYNKLYDLIGGTWGETENTFFLPDLQGKFVRGWDKDGDIDPSRRFGSSQNDAFQGHLHKIVCSENGEHFHQVSYLNESVQTANTFYTCIEYEHVRNNSSYYNHCSTDSAGNHKHEVVIGDAIDSSYQQVRFSTETRPKNIALMYCIKVV